MWSFESVVLWRDDDGSITGLLLIKTLLVDCGFGEIWFDDMHFAEMPSALALVA